MKYLFSILICWALSSGALCQNNWQPIAPGLDRPIRAIYNDTTDNLLYIGGPFSTLDGKNIRGVARWNGAQWDSLTGGIDAMDTLNNAPNNTLAFCRYGNYLYVAGAFNSVDGYYSKGIARWDGNTWDSIPCCPNSSIFDMIVFNNELFVVGKFDSIAGIPAYGIAKWNDTIWSDAFNFPQFTYSSAIYSIAIYNNELYIGGSFRNNFNDPEQNIMRWDGNAWKPVGNGIRGGGFIGVLDMVVFQNELYVGGIFFKSNGNAGNYIQKWNGTTWSDVGGGTGGQNGEIRKMFVHDNDLYALGVFEQAGGVPANRIAKWDGYEWCSLGSQFDNVLITGAVYNDSLIIGGGFWTIDGDSIVYMAKWAGGNYTDTCGNSTNIPEILFPKNKLRIYPNPTDNFITIELPDNLEEKLMLSVFDIFGKELIKMSIPYQTNNFKIDLKGLTSGIYYVSVKNDRFIFNEKMIKK